MANVAQVAHAMRATIAETYAARDPGLPPATARVQGDKSGPVVGGRRMLNIVQPPEPADDGERLNSMGPAQARYIEDEQSWYTFCDDKCVDGPFDLCELCMDSVARYNRTNKSQTQDRYGPGPGLKSNGRNADSELEDDDDWHATQTDKTQEELQPDHFSGSDHCQSPTSSSHTELVCGQCGGVTL